MMFCGNCYKEIPVRQDYFRHHDSHQCYCSVKCLVEWLINRNAVTLIVGTEQKNK